jgi:uncharacterized protein (UPF0305 family)
MSDVCKRGTEIPPFFQAACAERRRRNKIGILRKEDGSWVEEKEKRRFIANYFWSLFRSNGSMHSHELTDIVQPRVTEEMNDSLVR